MGMYEGKDTSEKQNDIRRQMKRKQKVGSSKKQKVVEVDKSLLNTKGFLKCRSTFVDEALGRDMYDNFKSSEALCDFVEALLEKKFIIADVCEDSVVKTVFINQRGFRPNEEAKFFFVMGVNLVVRNPKFGPDWIVRLNRRDGRTVAVSATEWTLNHLEA